MTVAEETDDLSEAIDNAGAAVPDETAYLPSGAPLRDGRALTVDEANTLASETGATLVMPLGPVKVGKTTLAVELYARYLRYAKWAGLSFCGSHTLLDYEMLAFPSRLKSGGDLPETWRTRLEEERHLLHMRVEDDHQQQTNLLFANLSGELSENIRDGAAPADEMPLLARAHRVLICVDGEWVASPSLRGRAISETRQLLGTLAENGVFMSGARAALVLTKWDKVVAAGEQEQWETAEAQLAQRLGKLGMGDISFRTAARPETASPPGDDTEALMRWLVERVQSKPAALPPVPPAKRALGRRDEPR